MIYGIVLTGLSGAASLSLLALIFGQPSFIIKQVALLGFFAGIAAYLLIFYR